MPLPLAFIPAPLAILVVSVLFIIGAIAWGKLHPFFALVFAALLVGVLSAVAAPEPLALGKVVETVMVELGIAAGKIAFTIAIAAVLGLALMESGAADKIVRRFVAVLGESRAEWALLASGFILSIPVFFDTAFFLLVPLARALSLRTGKNYLLYVLAISAGGVITHGTVPPTPGPLLVAELLPVDLGLAIVGGILFGVLPALAGLAWCRWVNARYPVPLRECPGASLESLAAVAARRDDELPGFAVSIAPIVLPILLIALTSILTASHVSLSPGLTQAVAFFGNKNIALLLGAIIALAVYARQKQVSLRSVGTVLGPPLETAGIIILITSAGGAFGAMINKSGLGAAITGLAGGSTINFVILAWVLAVVVRVAQGSATVAMITASTIILSMAGPAGFGVHPFYIFMAVGYGGFALSWMNDSGFWIFSRMGGFTERETLRTWTPLLTIMSVIGLLQILLASALWPNLWF
jgi:GntP family gluconate:H+ symporter